MTETPYEKVALAVRAARVCPRCGAMIYDRDDAERAHQAFHINLDILSIKVEGWPR